MTATAPAAERVLVVDDEADILALVTYHLAKSGYRVSTAATGPEALRAARDERPALIVLDLMLPGMSGFEVLEQLRADSATSGIAVLMLTARREEPDRIRGLSIGADDYLTKPFSPQELVLRVGAILRRTAAGAAASPSDDPLRSGPCASTAARIACRSTDATSSSRPPSTSCCSRSPSGAVACRRARISSRRCGRRRPTSRRAPWTCTFSGCARSSGRRAS